MAKRRKPKVASQPLLIVDNRDQPKEAWVPASQLPPENIYGYSEIMLICQMIPGDRRPTLMTASYDFSRNQWRTNMGPVENVTHWQPLPDYPKEYEYQND